MIEPGLWSINTFLKHTKKLRDNVISKLFEKHVIEIDSDDKCLYRKNKNKPITLYFSCFYCTIIRELQHDFQMDKPFVVLEKAYVLKYDNPVNVVTSYFLQNITQNVIKKYIAYYCSNELISLNSYIPEILFISQGISKYIEKIEELYNLLRDNNIFLFCDIFIGIDNNVYIHNFKSVILDNINLDCYLTLINEKIRFTPLKVGYNISFYYMLISFIKKYKLFNNTVWHKFFDAEDLPEIKQRFDKEPLEILQNIKLIY